MKSIFRFILGLVLTGLILAPLMLAMPAQAGCVFSKSRHTEHSQIGLLIDRGMLSFENAQILIFQHPGLTAKQVAEIIVRIKRRERRKHREHSQEKFMSKFALYASEMVGWRNP